MTNLNYFDKVFYLKFPKLLNQYETNKSTSNKVLGSINLNKNINNSTVDTNSNVVNTIPVNKFDKKYKSELNHNNLLDIKKNRNKQNKKNRKNIIFESEDLQISSNSIFDSNVTTSLKSHKINKYKKKDKRKVNLNDELSQLKYKKNQITIDSSLSIEDLSNKLDIPEAEIITNLFLKGISVTINDIIDQKMAKEIAKSYQFDILDKELSFNTDLSQSNNNIFEENTIKRAPIITIFGHVDHGKTTLLDSILNTNLAKKEFGGITQAINGYEIEYSYKNNVYNLVFLDTPGHEAFTSMRLRGARITDIALLVVAADDGLKPQSIESIKYILSMKLPHIIVINKIDKNGINLLKIKEELASYDLLCEEWGGNTKIIEVSALKRKNLDLLLSNICLLSSNKNFRASSSELATGTILEAFLDKKRGIIANLVVQDGTLKVGDLIIAENLYCKVKNIINYKSLTITQAQPSSIVQVLGFSVIPKSGILFKVINDNKEAKKYIHNFSNQYTDIISQKLKLFNKKVNIDSQINIKELNIILVTNTQGSLEAILDALSRVSQKKIKINLISTNSGNISSTNIELALTTNACIICFNVNISSSIRNLVKQYNLNLQVFYIIYDLLEYVQNYMLSLIDFEYEFIFIGRALVQNIFSINKNIIAGCLVNEGKLRRMSHINVYRDNNLVYEGKLTSLKRIKDDVDEVLANNECGLMCNFDSWQKMDVIEAYDSHAKIKSL